MAVTKLTANSGEPDLFSSFMNTLGGYVDQAGDLYSTVRNFGKGKDATGNLTTAPAATTPATNTTSNVSLSLWGVAGIALITAGVLWLWRKL